MRSRNSSERRKQDDRESRWRHRAASLLSLLDPWALGRRRANAHPAGAGDRATPPRWRTSDRPPAAIAAGSNEEGGEEGTAVERAGHGLGRASAEALPIFAARDEGGDPDHGHQVLGSRMRRQSAATTWVVGLQQFGPPICTDSSWQAPGLAHDEAQGRQSLQGGRIPATASMAIAANTPSRCRSRLIPGRLRQGTRWHTTLTVGRGSNRGRHGRPPELPL